jgi:AAA+ superfamily predicted ATPase
MIRKYKIILQKVKKEDDKISVGFLLSRLDGIGNYDGLIIVATTNYPEKIDKTIYRDGRLTLMNFSCCNKQTVIKFIEKFHDIKLTKSQINRIKDNFDDLVPAKLIGLLEKHKDSINDLLSLLQ